MSSLFQEGMFQLEEVMACCHLLTRHFSKERREVGLHGLYGKYKDYVEALASVYSLLAHLVVFKNVSSDRDPSADNRRMIHCTRSVLRCSLLCLSLQWSRASGATSATSSTRGCGR